MKELNKRDTDEGRENYEITCQQFMFFYFLLQEVFRIRAEHPDDNQAVFNDRVKGQLKVTRAFGAGFLKKVSCACIFCFVAVQHFFECSAQLHP